MCASSRDPALVYPSAVQSLKEYSISIVLPTRVLTAINATTYLLYYIHFIHVKKKEKKANDQKEGALWKIII